MTSFQLPITYNRECKKLEQHVRQDMELVSDDALYSAIMPDSTPLGKRTLPLWGLNYTTDRKYLKDTQKIIRSDIKPYANDATDAVKIMEKINSDDDPHEDDGGFHAKYQYIEWSWLQRFNENSIVLQWLSIYNLASPVLSLCLPIFFLILSNSLAMLSPSPSISRFSKWYSRSTRSANFSPCQQQHGINVCTY